MSRIHVGLSLCLVLLASSLAACGGDDDDDGGGGPSGTPAEFFDSLKASVCDFEVRCGAMPDVATCQSVTFLSNEQVSVIAYVDKGTVVYDSDAAAACLDFVDGLTCDVDLFAVQAEFVEKCGVVLTGQAAAGAACTFDEECVAGSSCQQTDPSCDSSQACCAGTCAAAVPPTEVALGGDCSQNPNCVAGAYCKTDGQTGVCTAQVTEESAACDAFDACKSPLVCNLDFTTSMGTCYRPADSGATCDPDVLFGACAKSGDYCDATAMTCKAKGKPGDACAPDSDSCVGYAECVASVCEAKPLVGDACTGSGGDGNCLGDLVCGSDAKCAAPPAATACP